ncbi:ATPase family associated with various cellular activities (AAA) [Paenimyroides ummariense]|uniref:ATPase family associated with various cellular activities (AAA) n=1 Tax=Paenimyroides ummariense TaxID=913024 RepID=A0A1I5BZU5_9FLAO|nr:ATP-binding protein [Paenimyroides ummariense]SFN80309.1 ATPase family associated with various cellular activities (AAA) [Paenimyroides ummariense]
MSSYYYIDRSSVSFEDFIASPEIKSHLMAFLHEQQFKHLFDQYKIPISNKLLLYGDSGTGKTMTAKVIANHLNKKLMIVNLATIISSKLGETAKNLDLLFKESQYESMVLLLDEFDSLGQIRDYDNKDNSEMKRVVNAIIQLMDYFPQKSILIAATNQVHMIDEALKRRFEWQISYEKPSNELLDDLYETLKIPIPEKYHPKKRLYQVSYAQAKDDFYKQVKQNIINEQLS